MWRSGRLVERRGVDLRTLLVVGAMATVFVCAYALGRATVATVTLGEVDAPQRAQSLPALAAIPGDLSDAPTIPAPVSSTPVAQARTRPPAHSSTPVARVVQEQAPARVPAPVVVPEETPAVQTAPAPAPAPAVTPAPAPAPKPVSHPAPAPSSSGAGNGGSFDSSS